MRRIIKKMSSCSGETIVELLCSILIVSVALAALCSAILVSSRVNKQIKEINRSFVYIDKDEKGEELPPVEVGDTAVTCDQTEIMSDDSSVKLYRSMEKYYYFEKE